MAETSSLSPDNANQAVGLGQAGEHPVKPGVPNAADETLKIEQLLASVRNIQSNVDGSVESAKAAQGQIEGLIGQITRLAANLPVEKYVALLGELAKVQTAAEAAVKQAEREEKAAEELVAAVQQAFGKDSPYAVSHNNSGMETVDAEAIKAIVPDFGLYQSVVQAVPSPNSVTLAQKAAIVAPILQTPAAVASYLGRSTQVQATHTVLTNFVGNQAALSTLAPQVLTKANIDSFRNPAANAAFLQQAAAVDTALEARVKQDMPELQNQKITPKKLDEVEKVLKDQLGVVLDPALKAVLEEKINNVRVLNENKGQQTIVMVVNTKEGFLSDIRGFQDMDTSEILRKVLEGRRFQQQVGPEKKTWVEHLEQEKLTPQGNLHKEI